MKGLFIFLVVLSLLFFATKLGISIWTMLRKEIYFNNKIDKGIKDFAIIGYIVLVYAFSISLYLAEDYTIAECNFTLIILSIATALFVGEKVYFCFKNRGQIQISSNIYDLSELVKLPEMQGVIEINGKQQYRLLDKEKFESLLIEAPKCDSRKLFETRMAKACLVDGAGILLCVVILVIGLVRGV